MKLPKFSKKLIAIGAAAGIAMGAAGIAAAYFSATGTGTGKAAVGTATPFTVTFKAPTGTLYPNQSQTLHYTVKNNGGGTQHYTITTADYTITHNVGGTVTGTPIGKICKAAWFTVSTGAHAGTLVKGQTVTLTVKLTMSNGTGSGSTQDGCEGVHPKITLSFTS